MNVVVEDISTVAKKIVVEIPAQDVKQALSQKYKEYARTRRVRGFRQGKLPTNLAKQMFHREASAEVGRELIQSNAMAAFLETGLELVDMSDIEPAPIVEGQPFVFSIRCEVKPAITLQGIDTLRAERNPVEPTDEDIRRELEKLREQHAELEPVEGRGADIGDVVTIDYEGRLVGEEEPFPGGAGKSHDLELGTGSLVPGFEDQLMGAVEEEERTVEITFPDDYAEHLAGKAATFSVAVKAVRRRVFPDLDDAFAVDLEYEDLGALRASVYDRLVEERRQLEDARLRGYVIDTMLEANPLEVPPKLIGAAAEALRRQLALRLAVSGMPREEISKTLSSQEEYILERAREMAHRDLLLDALVREQGLEVTDADVEERLQEIAEKTRQPAAKVRATYHEAERMDALRADILQEIATRWLERRAIEGPPAAPEPEAAEPGGKEPAGADPGGGLAGPAEAVIVAPPAATDEAEPEEAKMAEQDGEA